MIATTKFTPNGGRFPIATYRWKIYAHPLFLQQLEQWVSQFVALRRFHPQDYQKHTAAKRLAALTELAFRIIPKDPTRPDYRQTDEPNDERRRWRRATFFQQWKLFFRYHATFDIVVLVWIDEQGNDDAYRVFRAMHQRNAPPANLVELNTAIRAERLQHALSTINAQTFL